MGNLYYGNSTEPIEIPDRVLAHLKVIAATKLRRSESFTVSWNKPGDSEARTTIWLQAAIPLRFELERSEPIDRRYLEDMAQAAASSAGVFVDLAAEAIAAQPVADLRRVA